MSTATVVPTSGTIKAAKALIRLTPERGAEAAIAILPTIPDEQIPALVALLARHAASVTAPPAVPDLPQDFVLTGRARPGQPPRLTEAQRREAHRRYRGGDRSPGVVMGEREYQKLRKRVSR